MAKKTSPKKSGGLKRGGKTAKKEPARKGGISPRTFGGLSKERYTKKTGTGQRLQMAQGDTRTVQFVADISDEKLWKEIDQHQFQDGGKWKYVPCLADDDGNGCPLCDDEDPEVKKVHYRFFTVVYSFKDKAYVIMEGPKDLSGRIAFRYEGLKKKGKEKLFIKKTFDVSKLKTTPVSYDVESGDDDAKKLDPKQFPDLDEYLDATAKSYYGDSLPTGKKSKGKTALDDDDDDEDADEFDEDELMEMDWSDLKKVATNLRIKLIDSDGEKRKRKTLVKLILKKQ